MPMMPRVDKKTSKIAFNILGTPANMIKGKKRKKRDIPTVKKNANYEELSRINSK